MASVTFKGVVKKFGSYVAVSNLDLEIRDEEFFVLLGPSGCGKTTTMRMVAGLEEVSAGEIKIGSDRVNDVLPKYRDVAMVFQSYALYPHLTVERNISYPLRVRKVPMPEQRRLVAEVARRVELEVDAEPPTQGAFRRPAPTRGSRPCHRANAQGLFDG